MDSYSKYWNPWYFLFKKHCKNHGPIYFLSEDKEPDFISEVIHFKTGKGEWGERLLSSLNQIEDDLVFESLKAASKYYNNIGSSSIVRSIKNNIEVGMKKLRRSIKFEYVK